MIFLKIQNILAKKQSIRHINLVKNKSKNKNDLPKIIRNIDINYEMVLKNSKLDFSGIPVFFPYEAYEIQRIYIQ